mgnify:CR=1 FL=1
MGEYGLCKLWRDGVSDLGELRFRIANWREFGVEGLDACAFAPGEPARRFKLLALGIGFQVLVLVGKVPALLPAVG